MIVPAKVGTKDAFYELMKEKGKKMLGKRIVMIDDDESVRKEFFFILNKNYRVYLAKDSSEVDRLKNE